MINKIVCAENSCSDSVDRYFHTSTLFKNYIITYGGYSRSSQRTLSDIRIFNLKKNSFEVFNLEGDEPTSRFRHSACLIDENKILIFGGSEGNSILKTNTTAMITIKETLPLTLTYKNIETTGGEDLFRSNHSADIYQNKMYVFGGRHLDNPEIMDNNELWSLDLEPRAAHSSVIYNDKLYIFGGFADSASSAINSYSVLSFGSFFLRNGKTLENMHWENLEIENFLPRYGASSVVLDDTFYILGGHYKSQNLSNEVLTLNLANNTLDCLECQGDYLPVIGGTAVYFKEKIILWGGLQSENESISKMFSIQSSQKDMESFFEGASESFSSYAAPLFGSEKYADVHFSIQGQKIPAHKLILDARCKYFANLFKSGMKESHSSVIEIKDFKPETFKAFLRFLYQNESELTETLALDLYALSSEYTQPELLKICENFLGKNVKLDNLVTLIEFAEKFGAESLKDSILEFMMKNLEEIKQSEIQTLVPPSYVWEVASRFKRNEVAKPKSYYYY